MERTCSHLHTASEGKDTLTSAHSIQRKGLKEWTGDAHISTQHMKNRIDKLFMEANSCLNGHSELGPSLQLFWVLFNSNFTVELY